MATPEKLTLRKLLMDTLDDLSNEHLEKFKFFLLDKNLLKTFKVIPRHQLETHKRTQILKAMMDAYGNHTINIIKRVLELIPRKDLIEQLSQWHFDPEDILSACQTKIKTKLNTKFRFLNERISKKRSFGELYTELYVKVEDPEQVSEVHELTQIEEHSRKPLKEVTIHCQDIFRGNTESTEPIREELTERRGPIRTVLTKGVAGVGKTVLTQKFILDWAEGRANQDIQLLFPFTFRELNGLRDSQFSLAELLNHFFGDSAALCSLEHLQVVFIFDGLDECRFPLDFSRTRVLTETTESVPVEVLLVNLIRGDLLPSARLWITTRPAAARQIPVSVVTEVRGFTDPQKEQYFSKRLRNEPQATAVIAHIRKSRILHAMCNIPIFCSILSTVIENILKNTLLQDLPKTLTNLYIHFLVVQLKQKNLKYNGQPEAEWAWSAENRKMVESLGKLAFEQLQKGNLIFYESDLSECGLEPTAASVYSGVFTQVFREEPGLYQDKVYCFIHLSIQEFLAALHVHLTFFNSGVNLLSPQQTFMQSVKSRLRLTLGLVSPEAVFYEAAVDQALQSPNGHLDLLLRFLLGLSLPTNQSLLRGLLTQTECDSQTNQKTVQYIRERLDEHLSAERSMNLIHCLNELNDHSLLEDIQKSMRNGLITRDLSPAEWSAVAFLILSSDSDLEEFDLREYSHSEEVLLRLLPVVKVSTKAILSSCHLSQSSCGPLSSALSCSSLTHLDLSSNHIWDSGVGLLCSGLTSAPCRLETLRLSSCDLSERSCAALASVLSCSSLTHLDLSNNNLQDAGVGLLCSGLESAPCRLETLRLSGCLVSERGGAYLASALSPAHSRLRALDLSYNHPGPSAQLLSALRDAPHCPLDSLRLDPTGERWMVPGLRKYFCEFSLDPCSAHRKLRLFNENRSVSHDFREQRYPDHPDRFRDQTQVLSCTGLTGLCYWEVEWLGLGVEMSLTAGGPADGGRFGDSGRSWSLRIHYGKYSVCHGGREVPLASRVYLPRFTGGRGSSSGRVGVFLDSEAGLLSFYEVCVDGRLILVHSFSGSFCGPLFPGLGAWAGSSLSLVDLKEVTLRRRKSPPRKTRKKVKTYIETRTKPGLNQD